MDDNGPIILFDGGQFSTRVYKVRTFSSDSDQNFPVNYTVNLSTKSKQRYLSGKQNLLLFILTVILFEV